MYKLSIYKPIKNDVMYEFTLAQGCHILIRGLRLAIKRLICVRGAQFLN